MPKAQYDITAQQRGTNQDQPITWKVGEIIGTAKLIAVDASGAPTLVNIPTSTVINVNFEKTLFVNPTAPNATDTRSGDAADKYDANYPFVTLKAAMVAASDGDNIFIGGGAYTYTLTADEDYSAKVVDWHFGAGTSFTLAGACQLIHYGDIYGDCGAFTVGAGSSYTNQKVNGAKVKVESMVASGTTVVSSGIVELVGDLSGAENFSCTKLICNNITGGLGDFQVAEVICSDITADVNFNLGATTIECRSITTAQTNVGGSQLKITASGTVAAISNLADGSYIKAQSVDNLDATGNSGSMQVVSETSIGTVAGAGTNSLVLKCGTSCGNVTFTSNSSCAVKLIGGDFGNVGSGTYAAVSINYACESVGNVWAGSHYGKVDSAGDLLGTSGQNGVTNASNLGANSVNRLDAQVIQNTRIESIVTLNISDINSIPSIKLECNKIVNVVAVNFSAGRQGSSVIDISAKYIGGYNTTGSDSVNAAHTVVLRGVAIASKPVLAPGCELHLVNCFIYHGTVGEAVIGVDRSPANTDSIIVATAAVRAAGVVTMTLNNTGPAPLVANDKISIEGFQTTAINSPVGTDINDGVFTVVTATATEITYDDPRSNATASGTMGSVYSALENVTVRAYQGATNRPLYSASVVGLIDSSNTIYDEQMLAV